MILVVKILIDSLTYVFYVLLFPFMWILSLLSPLVISDLFMVSKINDGALPPGVSNAYIHMNNISCAKEKYVLAQQNLIWSKQVLECSFILVKKLIALYCNVCFCDLTDKKKHILLSSQWLGTICRFSAERLSSSTQNGDPEGCGGGSCNSEEGGRISGRP